MEDIPFRQKELEQARTLLKEGAVRSLTFSEGTYQAEVVIKNKAFWPFLLVGEEGELNDAFCSCPKAENRPYCVHIATAYAFIFPEAKEPLHVRFRSCLWNRLCWIASRRHGYRTDCLEKTSQGYEAKALTGKTLFVLKALSPEGEEKIKEMIETRKVETEETSLKFSNLDPHEIALWKQGKPTEKLKYELSFWADLAKECFLLQDKEISYQVSFSPEDDLPKWIHVRFSSLELSFYVSKGNWRFIIPSLPFIHSPFTVREMAKKEIRSIHYEPARRQFLLDFATPLEKDVLPLEESKHIDLDGWTFIPKQGFFRIKTDPIFAWNVVSEEKISEFITQYADLLRNYLKEPIFEGKYPLQYHLRFDEKQNLHVEMFLFKQGDLQKKDAAFLGRWVYMPGQGFYSVEPSIFSSIDTIIPADQVGDFVSRHKGWLNRFEGFQIHLMTVEPEISYYVDDAKTLCFSSQMQIVEDVLGTIDFGEWIFIPSRGFFPKRKEKMIASLKHGKKILEKEIPMFLRLHKEELSSLSHFFSDKNPTAQFSLEVSIVCGGAIYIKPVFSLLPEYKAKRVLFFEEYAYVEGEGFSKFLLLHPFLEEYAVEKTLSAKEQLSFLSRLSSLKPWISKLDPRLNLPKEQTLHIAGMQEITEGRNRQWQLHLEYKTDLGNVDLFEVWKAVQGHERFFFSNAGLFDLSEERFSWLKNLSKKKWGPGGKSLSLSAMEWIRLQMTESISILEDPEIMKTFEDFHSYQGCDPYSLEGLKSDLRSYQETGLKWLWFLYSYGLSGLLCDEMGLGKTHQAMALLAAVSNAGSEAKKFLIVCPTSVMYHWEALLKRFLPSLRVCLFYGQSRNPNDLFNATYDVLLTSYGVMRSEKKQMSQILFDLAIYDEVQNAKNASSQTHRALASLQAFMKIGLTGTPIENHILELKALFDLILPHYLPNDAQFKEHFLLPIERTQDPDKKKLLSKLIKPFILRRKKSEVLLELPEKIEEIAYCELSTEQKELYRSFFLSQKQKIEEELKTEPTTTPFLHVFSLLSKLKQICDHPSLILKDKEEFGHHTSGKWELFVELLAEARASKQKVVVFTQFLDMMDIIELYLKHQGIEFAEIRGSTRDRKEPLQRFKEDPECEVFVASLQAAGVGIDLTAASIVIHYDRWWNPAKEDQATDRVHRMGQSRGVQVFKLVTKKTVEENIHALILKKKGILDEVVGFDDQDVIKRLTKQEIFELLAALEKDVQEGQ